MLNVPRSLRRQSETADSAERGGLLDHPQIDHESSGSRDQETSRALYLDASQNRPDVSLSADLPCFVQDDVAISHVGRPGQYTAIARGDRRSDFGG
jgi:hypothetical protein